MDIERVSVASLSLDPANARKHSLKNMDAIKGSLRRFGQQKPIVIDGRGVVIAGNGTLQAARELGWKEIAAVRTELEGVEAMAFALADNRAGELASWDFDILGRTLVEMRDFGFEIGQIGFDESFFIDPIIVEPEPAPTPSSSPSQPPIDGSGYVPPAVAPNSESIGAGASYEGMPEFQNEDLRPAKSLLIHFKTMGDYRAFAATIGQSLTEQTRSTWWPEVERISNDGLKYVDTSEACES